MDEIRITAFNSELGRLLAKYGFTAIVAAMRRQDAVWDITALGNRKIVTDDELVAVNTLIVDGLNVVFGSEVQGFQTGIIRVRKDDTAGFDEMPH